jgi:hypothetical protein
MTSPIKPRIYHRSTSNTQAGLRPIVLEYRAKDDTSTTRRRSGERYSEDLEDVQRTEADLVRVMRRATRAVSHGVDTYDRERSRSAQEKTDGAVEDFPHNYAKAVSETIKEASELPLDVADALAPRNYGRRARRTLKQVSRTLRLFRL